MYCDKVTRKDYVSILFETLNESIDTSTDAKDSKDVERVEKKLTLDEIKVNMLGFLIGGFDTMSTALNLCLYVLAKHPEQVSKLQAELDHVIQTADVSSTLPTSTSNSIFLIVLKFKTKKAEINYETVMVLSIWKCLSKKCFDCIRSPTRKKLDIGSIEFTTANI